MNIEGLEANLKVSIFDAHQRHFC